MGNLSWIVGKLVFTTCPWGHYGYFPPTILTMNRMKMIAKNPAAPTAAFVKAPEMDTATVRAANEMPMTRSTRAASGELILDVTPNVFFTVLLRRVDVS